MISCEVGESLKKWEETQGLAETQWRWWGSPVQQLRGRQGGAKVSSNLKEKIFIWFIFSYYGLS